MRILKVATGSVSSLVLLVLIFSANAVMASGPDSTLLLPPSGPVVESHAVEQCARDDSANCKINLPLEVSASPYISGMQIFFGDLHSHTGYSDGHLTPADAYAAARANGLDFFALTEHGFMLTAAEWQDLGIQADAITADGDFVALRGFEYTNAKGHIDVFGTDSFVSRDNAGTKTLDQFYGWLVTQPTAIGQFNHPFPNFNFNDFAYSAAVDEKITLREIPSYEQFFLSLNQGWHLGTLVNTDTHDQSWGCCVTMGLLAPNLTRPDILAAMKAGRTFLVSPHDRNLAVVLQANGAWMGSTVPRTSLLHLTVNAHDPDPTGANLNLVLYDNGVRVAAAWLQSSLIYTWNPTVVATPGHYYYVEAFYDGWPFPPAFSSPIWVE